MKIDLAKIWFLFLPLTIIFFFPSKSIFGEITVLDVFIIIFLFLFFFKLNKKFEYNSIHIFILLIILFSFISFQVNFSHFQNIKYWLRFPEYFLIFFFTFQFYSNNVNKYLIKGLIFSFICLFVFGIAQIVFPQLINLFSWGPEWKEMYVITKKVRVYSFLDNPLNLVAFISLILGFLIVIKIKYKLFILFFVYVLLILTGSKIGLVVILLSLGSFLIKIIRSLKIKIKYIFFLSFFVAIALFLIGTNKYQKVTIFKRLNNVEETGGSKNQRILIYKSAFKMISDYPVFGIGAGNFKKIYKDGYQLQGSSDSESSFTSENLFLDFYLDNGLIPTALFVIILLIIFISPKFNDLFLKGIHVGIFFLIIVGLVTNLRSAPVFMLLFFMMAVFFKRKSNLYEQI